VAVVVVVVVEVGWLGWFHRWETMEAHGVMRVVVLILGALYPRQRSVRGESMKMDHRDVELMVLLEQETVTLVMELETEVMMTGDPVVAGGMGMVWLEVEIL
jgi:hypothetical protein